MNSRQNLGVIGCGRMAYALLAGLTRSGHQFARLAGSDVDAARAELCARDFGMQVAASNAEVAGSADVLVLAVKPAQVPVVLDDIRDRVRPGTLLVSIAAGVATSDIERRLPAGVAVVRVMPNTPCLVGEGASAVARGASASAADEGLVLQMFAALGQAVAVPESAMDAVTALSGSGPAYVYLVAEAMVDAGVEVGLPRDLARALALQTLKGSVAMLQTTGEHPAVLREQVTSPGGTTIAGLRQLEEGGLRAAFFRAVRSAYQRSIELGRG